MQNTMHNSKLTDAPEIDHLVGVLREGVVYKGVVNGLDTKDGKPIIDYECDHICPDGKIVKAQRWAWLDQIVSNSGHKLVVVATT